MALAPLRQFGLKTTMITTLQAISGAGYPGVASWDILGNVIPHIGGEEEKIETETRSLDSPQAGGLPSGARYDVTSQVPILTVGELDRPFGYDRLALSDYLSVGRSVPGVVK